MNKLHLKWVRERMTIADAEDLYNIKGEYTVCEDGQVTGTGKE